MIAFDINIFTSSAHYAKFLEKPMKGCFYFMTSSNVQITTMQKAMQFLVRGNLKYLGLSLNFLPRFSENLSKSSYKIENSGNFCKL